MDIHSQTKNEGPIDPFPQPNNPIHISTRLYTSFFSTKFKAAELIQ